MSGAQKSLGGTAVPKRAALLAGSRYELLVKIATGGTATVYVGRVTGSVGFSRLVAIKRAHPHLRDDPTARAALIREATLASRVHHANIVPIHDVEETEDELLLVMDYIEGGALSDLLDASGGAISASIGLRILLDAVAGLSAVHALTDEAGRDVGMIHRDVSPQNILVGIDGTARLTDFGLARLTEVSASATATVKGKIAYMAPEYIEGAAPTRQCDVFSMGVVVWETLAGERLFRGTNDADTLRRVVSQPVPRISEVADVPGPFDGVLARALAKDPTRRYRSIDELEAALADVAKLVGVARAAEVGEVVRGAVGKTLARRRDTVRMMADPENATGSMLLDELPIPVAEAPSVPPPAPPVRPIEPTIRLADALPSADETEEDTLRTAAKKKGLPVKSMAIVVGAIVVAGLAIALGGDEHAKRERVMRTIAPRELLFAPAAPTPTVSAVSPRPTSSASVAPTSNAPAPAAQPAPPASLPDNPYRRRKKR